jgi:hypothetical protein
VKADLGGEVGEGGAELGFGSRLVGEIEESVDVGLGLLVGQNEIELLHAQLNAGAISGEGAAVKLFLIDENRLGMREEGALAGNLPPVALEIVGGLTSFERALNG